jgi:hypothetical protein
LQTLTEAANKLKQSESEKDLKELATYKELQEAHEREVEYFMGKLDKMEAEKDKLAQQVYSLHIMHARDAFKLIV